MVTLLFWANDDIRPKQFDSFGMNGEIKYFDQYKVDKIIIKFA